MGKLEFIDFLLTTHSEIKQFTVLTLWFRDDKLIDSLITAFLSMVRTFKRRRSICMLYFWVQATLFCVPNHIYYSIRKAKILVLVWLGSFNHIAICCVCLINICKCTMTLYKYRWLWRYSGPSLYRLNLILLSLLHFSVFFIVRFLRSRVGYLCIVLVSKIEVLLLIWIS